MKRQITDDPKHQAALDEDIKGGEQSIDNALDAAHEAGLYENQDEEHPGELGIAGEVQKDELEHQKTD